MSSLENTSQQTAKPESTSTSINASHNVTKETACITNVTRQISKFITDNTTAYQQTSITTVLTSHATHLQETTLITTVSKERVSEASIYFLILKFVINKFLTWIIIMLNWNHDMCCPGSRPTQQHAEAPG